MSTAEQKRYYTPEEYLTLERAAETKSEYFNGEIFAMAGASEAHNLIAGNTFAELRARLRDRPCRTYMADMRVKVSKTGLYTYPDVAVVCGEPRFVDERHDTLLNPLVIVEVLSPSTQAFDRGGKFEHYQGLESLQEYVLVFQDRTRVEQFVRQGEQWVLTILTDPEATLRLPSLECELPLSEIYAQVEFPEAGEGAAPVERR